MKSLLTLTQTPPLSKPTQCPHLQHVHHPSLHNPSTPPPTTVHIPLTVVYLDTPPLILRRPHPTILFQQLSRPQPSCPLPSLPSPNQQRMWEESSVIYGQLKGCAIQLFVFFSLFHWDWAWWLSLSCGGGLGGSLHSLERLVACNTRSLPKRLPCVKGTLQQFISNVVFPWVFTSK